MLFFWEDYGRSSLHCTRNVTGHTRIWMIETVHRQQERRTWSLFPYCMHLGPNTNTLNSSSPRFVLFLRCPSCLLAFHHPSCPLISDPHSTSSIHRSPCPAQFTRHRARPFPCTRHIGSNSSPNSQLLYAPLLHILYSSRAEGAKQRKRSPPRVC